VYDVVCCYRSRATSSVVRLCVSVYVSVASHERELCKMAEPSGMPAYGPKERWGPESSPHKGHFGGDTWT